MKYIVEIFHKLYYSNDEVKKMNGFERRRKEKKESILNTAFELFFTRGIKAVSIAEIAKKANVSQVSIYNFFGSKDNLIRQSIFSYYNTKLNEYELLLDSDLSFSEKFHKLLSDKMENIDHYGDELLQSDIWTDPIIQSFIQEYYQTHSLPFMIKFIEQGKKEGSINRNISNEAILIYIDIFKNAILKANLSKKASSDLSILFFFGILEK